MSQAGETIQLPDSIHLKLLWEGIGDHSLKISVEILGICGGITMILCRFVQA